MKYKWTTTNSSDTHNYWFGFNVNLTGLQSYLVYIGVLCVQSGGEELISTVLEGGAVLACQACEQHSITHECV